MASQLNNQLFELSRTSEDDYETCTGGLMEQNSAALDAAFLRVGPGLDAGAEHRRVGQAWIMPLLPICRSATGSPVKVWSRRTVQAADSPEGGPRS